ncbi:MAG: sugar ABC transporter permease [Candidatus Sumerlaeota bacterium]|nr:sugar ABC transporter permease [Candidatus Sumerlaeota bacterium]
MRKKNRWFGRAEVVGLAFATPWLIGLIVFGLYPIAASFYLSLCRYNIVRPPLFTGLENYRLLIFDDPHFWKSLWNTLYLTAFGLPVQLIAALTAALALNARVKGQPLFRAVIYLPTVVPSVATAIIWVWILNPEYGLFNAALSWFGINGPGWLTDPAWSKPALIIVGIWGIGNTAIIFLAGLQQVPQSLYEAAIVDGANTWQRFRNVTIPILSPVVFFNLVMGIIGSFQYFTHVYVMTAGLMGGGRGAGGPEFSTLVYPLYLYQNAFLFFRMGYASAMAWIMFLIVALILVVVFRTSKWVHYESA